MFVIYHNVACKATEQLVRSCYYLYQPLHISYIRSVKLQTTFSFRIRPNTVYTNCCLLKATH